MCECVHIFIRNIAFKNGLYYTNYSASYSQCSLKDRRNSSQRLRSTSQIKLRREKADRNGFGNRIIILCYWGFFRPKPEADWDNFDRQSNKINDPTDFPYLTEMGLNRPPFGYSIKNLTQWSYKGGLCPRKNSY